MMAKSSEYIQQKAEQDPVAELLQQMHTALLRLNSDRRILWMNPAAEALFGVSLKRFRGYGLETMMRSAEHIHNILNRSDETESSVTEHELILEIVHQGRKVLNCSVSPLGVTQTTGYLLEFTDMEGFITHQRQEAAANQRKVLDQFMRSIGHEVKNPLGGMKGAAQLLKRQVDERLHDYVNVIVNEVDRLNKLVERFRGGKSGRQLELVNIHHLAEHVLTLVQAEFGEQLKLRRDYDPSLPMLKADRGQMVQALLNLVRNAVEAGALNITIKSRVAYGVRMSGNTRSTALRLDIMDDGSGIPENIREQIFMPMITGRAEGTGIGLALTQEIILHHRGEIRVKSKPGHTCFSIFLPLEDNSEH